MTKLLKCVQMYKNIRNVLRKDVKSVHLLSVLNVCLNDDIDKTGI